VKFLRGQKSHAVSRKFFPTQEDVGEEEEGRGKAPLFISVEAFKLRQESVDWGRSSSAQHINDFTGSTVVGSSSKHTNYVSTLRKSSY